MHQNYFQTRVIQPIKCQSCPHIETRQLICTANQLTRFYMWATQTLNGLKLAKSNISHSPSIEATSQHRFENSQGKRKIRVISEKIEFCPKMITTVSRRWYILWSQSKLFIKMYFLTLTLNQSIYSSQNMNIFPKTLQSKPRIY